MSEIKVNKISPRTACGTVTLGDSGDTFTIPAGATINNQGTATNFGATGSASWTTTVKTSGFTAVAGEGYFVDTSSGAISINLPAGTAGAVVAISDYAKNFSTHAVTLVQNGSDKIGGSTNNATLSTSGIAVTLIFIDSTKGWIVTDDGNQNSASTNPFIEATGGTITTVNCNACRVHTFTGPGTFTVSKTAAASANNQVSYLVVAGGGSGASGNNNNNGSGGGGAGGFREDKSPVTSYTASPLEGAGAITISATDFPIVVGGGGAGVSGGLACGNVGNNSSFSTITSAGGGFGASTTGPDNGGDGGSGGGGTNNAVGGSGNTPSTSPAQGTNGGEGYGSGGPSYGGGGGGGATVAGTAGGGPSAGAGGTGATTSINGTPTAFSGGGGGGAYSSGSAGGAGTGGGGAGGNGSGIAGSGTANTGGGGGGNNNPGGTSGSGGSGIVIIRYKIA